MNTDTKTKRPDCGDNVQNESYLNDFVIIQNGRAGYRSGFYFYEPDDGTSHSFLQNVRETVSDVIENITENLTENIIKNLTEILTENTTEYLIRDTFFGGNIRGLRG
ncbi:MAG: hypothetical protein RBQ94_06480 [Methanimicrococcus sp.]|nr:hypothetical protein [Methanimicrococcus sp.]